MDNESDALKAAMEYMANKKKQPTPNPELIATPLPQRRPKDAATLAAEAAAKVEREAVCARWAQIVQSKSMFAELELPSEGLTLPMGSALKNEPFVITGVTLKFPLVYDREFTRCLEGDYACPDNAPIINIYVDYRGNSEDEMRRILDYLSDVLSSTIGKLVKLDEKYSWVEETDNFIIVECWDETSSWNMADYILKQNEGEENHSSDDVTQELAT